MAEAPWELESSVMRTPLQPLILLVVAIAGWLQRDQQAAIVYLLEENRVLKARLGGRKLRLCLLFIHPRAPNLISLRSAGTMPT